MYRCSDNSSALLNGKCHVNTLNNGIPVLLEKVPGVRSVAVGIFFTQGSRNETDAESGITHFTEHMLFKGNSTDSPLDIARQIDILGGQFDAMTDKECLCLMARFLDENRDQALKLLAQLVFDPEFPKSEIQNEIGVVLEEITLYQDDPESCVNEKLLDVCWNGDPLSRPILGDPKIIRNLTRKNLIKYHSKLLDSNQIVIAAAGNIDFDVMFETIERLFSRLEKKPESSKISVPDFKTQIQIESKQLEQNYYCIGIPWHSANDDGRYVGYLVNLILGGNMSSRLFQTLRERHGLTYGVYSFNVSFSNCGLLNIFASTRPKNFYDAVKYSLECMDDLACGNVTSRELEEAKTCLKSNIVMGFEGSNRRMNTLAKQLIIHGKPISMEEILDRVNAVTLADFKKLSEEKLGTKQKSFAALGPFRENIKLDDSLTLEILRNL